MTITATVAVASGLARWCRSPIGEQAVVDEAKIDEMVLALLYLTTHQQQGQLRAWKGHDWAALDRLHDQGMIQDPKSKAKSVGLTDEGARRSQELFRRHFEDGEQ